MSGESSRDRGCGAVFVISGPSGAGKSTLVRRLLASVGGLRFTVSQTTRPRRPEEEEGRDYYFVDGARFREMRDGGEFLEWAEVHGRLYGTARSELQRVADGEDAVLDLDVQGAAAVRQARPDAILIFVLPPGLAELRSRLEARGTSAEEIERRLETAAGEMPDAERFDYLVLNDRLEESEEILEAIVLAERSRMGRRRDDLEHAAATFPRP